MIFFQTRYLSLIKLFCFIREIPKYLEIITDWIQKDNEILLICFEDITEDPITEIKRMIDYLNMANYPSQNTFRKRISCLQRHQPKQVRNKHRRKQESNIQFSRDIRVLINQTIDKVDQIIKSRHFKGLPLNKYHFP